jgi:hypothetical protein
VTTGSTGMNSLEAASARGLLRAPLFHFLVLGFAGFAVAAVTRGPEASPLAVDAAPASPYEIVLDSWDIARLVSDYKLETGLAAGEDDKEALIATWADEEMLFREAMARGLYVMDSAIAMRLSTKMAFLDEAGEFSTDRARIERAVELGLHRDDIVVRRILVQKMKLVAALQAGADKVSDEELASWFAANRERFRQPPRVELEQLFFGSDEGAMARAGETLAGIRSGALDEEGARALSRPLASSPRLAAADENEIRKYFGDAFATEALTGADGPWRGPIRSAYGVHLLRTSNRIESALPGLDAVRSAALAAIRGEKRKAAVEKKLDDLRQRYTVRVEPEGVGLAAS